MTGRHCRQLTVALWLIIGIFLLSALPAGASIEHPSSATSVLNVRTSKGDPSYPVPIDVAYGYIPGFSDHVIGIFRPHDSHCVSGHDFKFKQTQAKDGTNNNRKEPATTFDVHTSSECFTETAKAVYDVGIGNGDGHIIHGPIRLTVTQSGPRYFISACTDKHPIISSCSVVLAPFKPTVILHV